MFRLCIGLCLFVSLFAEEDKITQTSIYKEFKNVGAQSEYLVEKLKEKGNFGLGISQALNGDVVAYNGEFYLIDSKFRLKKAKNKNRVAFAQVCDFKPKFTIKVKNIRNLKLLNELIESQINSKGPCAILIKGNFAYIQASSFKIKNDSEGQNRAHFEHEKGVMIGFWAPNYWFPIMPQEIQLCFLNEKKSKGGRVLDIHIDTAEIYIQPIRDVEINLPQS